MKKGNLPKNFAISVLATLLLAFSVIVAAIAYASADGHQDFVAIFHQPPMIILCVITFFSGIRVVYLFFKLTSSSNREGK